MKFGKIHGDHWLKVLGRRGASWTAAGIPIHRDTPLAPARSRPQSFGRWPHARKRCRGCALPPQSKTQRVLPEFKGNCYQSGIQKAQRISHAKQFF